MKKLLIGTTNPGKILEYKVILRNLPVELVAPKDLNIIANIQEDGRTFEENANKKVKFYSALAGNIPVIAEDSGLEIDYLNGEPGIKSRRWPGHEASDEELISMTIQKLKGVPPEKRGAQLRAVIALAIENTIETFEGTLRGVIMEKPIGKIIPGYPFRSLFYLPQIGRVLGELSMEEEAEIAHRKQAISKAMPLLLSYFNN